MLGALWGEKELGNAIDRGVGDKMGRKGNEMESSY